MIHVSSISISIYLYNLYFIEPCILNIFNIISKNYFLLLDSNRGFQYIINPPLSAFALHGSSFS